MSNESKPEAINSKNTSPENDSKRGKVKDPLKLLQESRKVLVETFNKRKQENSEYTALADKARDEMLRVDGAIKQVDLFIKQFKGQL